MKKMLLLVGVDEGNTIFALPLQRMISMAEGRRIFHLYKQESERLKKLGEAQDGVLYVMYIDAKEYRTLRQQEASFVEFKQKSVVVGSTPYYGRSPNLEMKLMTMGSVIAEL